MKIIYIEWYDHCGYTTTQWRFAREYEDLEPSLCHSIGFVIKETKDYYILAANASDMLNPGVQTGFSGDMLILKDTIKRKKDLTNLIK